MTPAKEKYQSRTEILQGTLDMLILQVLHRLERKGWIVLNGKLRNLARG